MWSEEAFVLAERRARALELEVCEAAGVDPRDVRSTAVVEAGPSRDLGMSADVPAIAYFRGDDGFTMDAAVAALTKRLEQESGAPPDRWRAAGTETSAADIAVRVATAPLFGGGTVAVVVDPAPLLRSKAEREALDGAIRTRRPGQRPRVPRAG